MSSETHKGRFCIQISIYTYRLAQGFGLLFLEIARIPCFVAVESKIFVPPSTPCFQNLPSDVREEPAEGNGGGALKADCDATECFA
jgi:hypothetical protein